MFLMRAPPTYMTPKSFHRIDIIRTAIPGISNMDLPEESWIQASVSTHMGGIDIRLIQDIALSAFISSISAT